MGSLHHRMNEYNQTLVGSNRRPPSLDPTDVHSLPGPPKPDLPGSGSWAPPLSQARRCAPLRETSARRGPGTPRASARPEESRSLPVSAAAARAPDLPRFGAEGEASGVPAQARLPPAAQRAARGPPRNRRRRRYHHYYRPPLRAQCAEGPTASHAARRQRLVAGAPPSPSAHWWLLPPLWVDPVIHWATRLLNPNVGAICGGEGARGKRRGTRSSGRHRGGAVRGPWSPAPRRRGWRERVVTSHRASRCGLVNG